MLYSTYTYHQGTLLHQVHPQSLQLVQLEVDQSHWLLPKEVRTTMYHRYRYISFPNQTPHCDPHRSKALRFRRQDLHHWLWNLPSRHLSASTLLQEFGAMLKRLKTWSQRGTEPTKWIHIIQSKKPITVKKLGTWYIGKCSHKVDVEHVFAAIYASRGNLEITRHISETIQLEVSIEVSFLYYCIPT